MSTEVTDAQSQTPEATEPEDGVTVPFSWKAGLALYALLIGPVGHDSVPMPPQAPRVVHQKPAPPKRERGALRLCLLPGRLRDD